MFLSARSSSILFVRGWGLQYPQYILMGSILAFCVLRAMGACGLLPWLHELVPDTRNAARTSAWKPPSRN